MDVAAVAVAVGVAAFSGAEPQPPPELQHAGWELDFMFVAKLKRGKSFGATGVCWPPAESGFVLQKRFKSGVYMRDNISKHTQKAQYTVALHVKVP